MSTPITGKNEFQNCHSSLMSPSKNGKSPLVKKKSYQKTTNDTRAFKVKTTEPVIHQASVQPNSVVILPQGRIKEPHHPIQCWAHSKSGRRCSKVVISREGEPIPIPYCDIHLKAGDGALRCVSHPFAGNCLIAEHDLPRHYRMVLWGKRGKCSPSNKDDRSVSYYPPNPRTGRNYIPFTKTLRTDNYNGVINPIDTGDLLQYASCPGPTERQNIRSTFQYFGLRNGKLGALEYVALEPIPKNSQLCQWYGSGWWSARDLKRADIGTSKYPAPKRQRSARTIHLGII